MTFIELLLKITPNPLLSILIWIFALLVALYLARKPFYLTIKALTRVINNAMRLAAASLLIAEKRIRTRNREILMAKGLENAERHVEREFDHINKSVTRNLQGYSALNHKISEVITKLEEDHNKSIDVPPSLPNWIPIIEAIAKIEHSGDTMVSNMLSEINRTLKEQHTASIENYRNSSKTRHVILNKMLPLWRKLQKTLNDMSKSVTSFNNHAKSIDRYMDEYEQIRTNTDKAARMLLSSALNQFVISGLLLLVAVGGAVINFNLIALPMSEMVGGGSYIGIYKTSDVAGMVITLVELSMGIFLMESLRITHLFPIIDNMDDKMRYRMIWITLTLLTVFAGVESALSFLRERMVADMAALRQMLAGVEQTGVSTSLIPSVGQMIMGFILPFALAFVAIPLESFISSTRIVLGIIAAGGLRLLAFILRLIGNIGHYLGKFVITVYDLMIFPTIWLEGVLSGSPDRVKTATRRKTGFGFLNKSKKAINNKDQTIELKEGHE
jgi:hypothetical protein